MSNSSIWPIQRNLLGAATLGQSDIETNGDVGVLHIPQIFNPEASPSDDLMLFRTLVEWGESYPYAEMHSVYSTARAKWTRVTLFNGISISVCY